MSEPKFTPGPWKAKAATICGKSPTNPEYEPVVAIMNYGNAQFMGNQSLIIAAPCMLEAIEAYLEAECPDSVQRAVDMMEAAVKRAKGGAE